MVAAAQAALALARGSSGPRLPTQRLLLLLSLTTAMVMVMVMLMEMVMVMVVVMVMVMVMVMTRGCVLRVTLCCAAL